MRRLITDHRASAILLDTRRDFAWLTVGGQDHVLYTSELGVASVVVTPNEATVLTPVNEQARIGEEEIHGLDLPVASLPWWQPGAVAEQASKLAGGGRVLRTADVATDLEALRTALVPAEHRRLEWLAEVTLRAVDSVMSDIRAGSTEDDVAAEVTGGLARAGIRVPVLLIAADDRIARYRHPISAGRPIERRVMLVVVAERWGLHFAHTQFAEPGGRPPAVDAVAEALARVLADMRAATIPGNTLGDALAAAVSAYQRVGLAEEWSLHHQGGTIGYAARERIALPGDTTPIRPGMAFAWNPSAVGFKLEETLYLDHDGRQHVLTGASR